MNTKEVVQKAAIDAGVNGVIELAKRCGLSYERTVRVWKGYDTAKYADVITVLNSVGLEITIAKGEE